MNMSSYHCCPDLEKKLTRIHMISKIIKIFAEESRLKLLCVLFQGKHCVFEIMRHVKMSQSLISHHLKDLKEAKLVTKKKRGSKVYYSLTPRGKYITDLLLFRIKRG